MLEVGVIVYPSNIIASPDAHEVDESISIVTYIFPFTHELNYDIFLFGAEFNQMVTSVFAFSYLLYNAFNGDLFVSAD